MRLASLLPQEPALNAATLAQFANALRALNERGVPYLVGGAYALKHYCGINRDTKDVDLFVERSSSTGRSRRWRTRASGPRWSSPTGSPRRGWATASST
nr:nucleotidyltransferase [Deltaproteobacteria bacterium]